MSGGAPIVVRGLALLRHGATAWSRSGQHTGRTDLELLESGLAEAIEARGLVAQLPLAAAFTSPLRRARATASALRLAIEPHVVDDLLEWDYGQYEGLTSAQIHLQRPGWDLFRDGCPGGEQPGDVARRADEMLDRFVLDPSVERVALVVAHGHILRVLATRYLGLPIDAGRRLPLAAAHLSLLGFDHSTAAIEAWNLPPTTRLVHEA